MHAPKGVLISIGGNVDKGTAAEPEYNTPSKLSFFEDGILKRILSEMKGKDSLVEVITTASEIPEEVGNNYVEAFNRLGCEQVHVMHIRNREDTQNPDFIERIRKADGVMFTGGNQMRLSMIFGGTEIHRKPA